MNNYEYDSMEISIDPNNWEAMHEDMVTLDPIKFHSKEKHYKSHIDFYRQDKLLCFLLIKQINKHTHRISFIKYNKI